MPARARKMLAKLLLAVSSLFIVAIVVEVGVRVAGVQPDFFFQLDPEVGAVHIPGKTGTYVFNGGTQFIKINSHGYRDRERTLTKEPNVVRVAVLGDSFVEAFQVPLERTFPWLMEEELNRICGADRVYEVLNFGVSGFGTAQELDTLRHRALRFEPDVVLLFLYPSNDIYNNSKSLDVEPNRVHYVLDEDGKLTRLKPTISDNPAKRWLRHHSKAYLFVRDRLREIGAIRRALTAVNLMQPDTDQEEKTARQALRELQNSRYQVPLSTDMEEAWQVTEALLAETSAVTTRYGAEFGIVIIPNTEEILDRGAEEVADPTRLDYQQSLRRVSEICERLGVSCLQLVDAFRGPEMLVDSIFIPLEGHWTEFGHSVAADETLKRFSGSICGRR